MKENSMLCIFWLLVGLLLCGCGAHSSAMPSPTLLTSTPTSFVVKTETPVPLLTPTMPPVHTSSATPTATPEAALFPAPDFAIEFSSGWRESCAPRERSEIWLSTNNSQQIEPLLQDTQADLHSPQWSPDGRWLAFIKSQPSIIPADALLSPTTVITGTTGVWVVHPDGTNLHQIGEGVQDVMASFILGSALTCGPESQIAYPPEWSPSGTYIVYVQWRWNDGVEQYSYFLADVQSGASRLLLTQGAGGAFVWPGSEDRLVLQGDGQQYYDIRITSFEDVLVNPVQLALPSDVGAYTRYFFAPSSYSGEVSVFFVDDSPAAVSIWRLNLSTGAWIREPEIGESRGPSRWLASRAVWCDDKQNRISVYALNGWQNERTIFVPSDIRLSCDSFNVFESQGRLYAIFSGLKNGIGGIWGLDLELERPKPVLLINSKPLPISRRLLSAVELRP